MRSFVIMVGLPTAIATAYFGFLASDVYVSETRYAIRTGERTPVPGLLATFLAPSGGGSAAADSQIVRDYILSRDMLDEIEKRMNLRRHYSSTDVDWFSRLKPDATAEEYLEYYRQMVDVTVESASNISILKVRAFDPIVARDLARNLIELSERLVNRLSDRITEDTLRFARSELQRAESGVRETNSAVTQFRNRTRSIDPGEETSAVLSIVTALESELARARTELLEAESVMQVNSPKVKTLRTRVAALARQVKRERERLASESGTALTRLIDSYEPLVLDQKLAEQRYASALSSLEVARAEAQRKQRYLVAFVQPDLPDEALEPNRLENILTVLFGSTLIYGIGALVIAAIRDHMDL